MILSKKSWHYFIYNKFYKSTPSNLCPYFWKVVLSHIILVPAVLLFIPARIFAFIYNDFVAENEKIEITYGEDVGFAVGMFIASAIVLCMLWMWFTDYEFVEAIGFIGYAILILILLVALSGYIVDRFKGRFTGKSIVGEYFKAKVNKYCPKIDWRE